ncbi:MAG: hypothetical protein ACTSYU_01320 [Promethearchaeota archaeon]
MSQITEQKQVQKPARKREIVMMIYNLATMKKELAGQWMQYISPRFEFSAKLPTRFPIHNNGVLIQKHIPKGQKFPEVRYYLVILEEHQDKIITESLVLGKKDISGQMAENLVGYLTKEKKMPKNVSLVNVRKNGKVEFRYTASKYDIFVLKFSLTHEIVEIMRNCVSPAEQIILSESSQFLDNLENCQNENENKGNDRSGGRNTKKISSKAKTGNLSSNSEIGRFINPRSSRTSHQKDKSNGRQITLSF